MTLKWLQVLFHIFLTTVNGLSCADVLLKNYSLTQQDKIFCLTMAQYPNVGALQNTDLQLEKYKTVGDSNFVPSPLAVENAYCIHLFQQALWIRTGGGRVHLLARGVTSRLLMLFHQMLLSIW